MKSSRNIAATLLCVLTLTQCATLRQRESESWSKAKQEWKSGDGKDNVVDLPSYDRNSTMQPPPETRSLARKKPERTASPKVAKAAKAVQPKADTKSATAKAVPPKADTKSAATDRYNDLITEQLWDELFPLPSPAAPSMGRNPFYSFAAFTEAATHFPQFLQEGTDEQRRRELAAFLAHIAVETGGLRYVEQLNVSHSYSVSNHDYPPVADKDYHGRGPLQLSYNYNYGQFSQAYFGDKNVLLEQPEMLTGDSVVSFASAIWFWMTVQPPKPSCHSVMVGTWQPIDIDVRAKRLPGFGITINIINALQCGKQSDAADRRCDVYARYCKLFGTSKGDNCDCKKQEPYGRAAPKPPVDKPAVKDIFEDEE